jgi:hypothetical protein
VDARSVHALRSQEGEVQIPGDAMHGEGPPDQHPISVLANFPRGEGDFWVLADIEKVRRPKMLIPGPNARADGLGIDVDRNLGALRCGRIALDVSLVSRESAWHIEEQRRSLEAEHRMVAVHPEDPGLGTEG